MIWRTLDRVSSQLVQCGGVSVAVAVGEWKREVTECRYVPQTGGIVGTCCVVV